MATRTPFLEARREQERITREEYYDDDDHHASWWGEETREDARWEEEEEDERFVDVGMIRIGSPISRLPISERFGLEPMRLEPIFQDQYPLSEDEWDDLWTNPTRKKETTNPKIGDITTITFIVNDEIESKMKAEEFDCPICYNSVSKWDAIHLNCSHAFCGSCVSNHLDTLHKNHALLPSCALCRNEYSLFEIPNPEICNEIEYMLRK